jgi:hypothetical protein
VGGERGTYCSGTGSQANIAFPYVSTIRSLISKEVVKEIVDLGCGDFEVARRILSPDLSYLGCDIVPGLVARNTARFGTDQSQVLQIRCCIRSVTAVWRPLHHQAGIATSLKSRNRYRSPKDEAVSASSYNRRANRRGLLGRKRRHACISWHTKSFWTRAQGGKKAVFATR